MTCVHETAARVRRERRARIAATPARVVGPTVAGLVSIVVAVLVALWFGASALASVIVALLAWLVATVVARRTVGSLAAGATLRLARVYAPGERVRIQLSPEEGEVDAEIVHVGLANTTLLAGDRLVVVANSRLLTARS